MNLIKDDRVNVIVYNHKTKNLEHDYSGTFLQFGVDYEEFDTGPGNFSTAIIIKDNGDLVNPHVTLVKKVLT